MSKITIWGYIHNSKEDIENFKKDLRSERLDILFLEGVDEEDSQKRGFLYHFYLRGVNSFNRLEGKLYVPRDFLREYSKKYGFRIIQGIDFSFSEIYDRVSKPKKILIFLIIILILFIFLFLTIGKLIRNSIIPSLISLVATVIYVRLMPLLYLCGMVHSTLGDRDKCMGENIAKQIGKEKYVGVLCGNDHVKGIKSYLEENNEVDIRESKSYKKYEKQGFIKKSIENIKLLKDLLF